MVNIPKDSAIQSGIEEIQRSNANKRQRKRPYANISPETTLERISGPDPKIVRDSYNKNEQVPLQEFYYGTLQPTRSESDKENNITFSFKVIRLFISFLISFHTNNYIYNF